MSAVLRHELALRGRGRTAPALVATWLVVLAGVAIVVMVDRAGAVSPLHATEVADPAAVGRAIFQWLVASMCVLMALMAPPLAASRLAASRESGALAAAQLTQLRPRSLAAGHVLAGFVQVVVLVATAAPLLLWPWALGGATAGQVVAAVGSVLAVGAVLVTVATCCAATAQRSGTAMAAAFAVVLVLLIGTVGVYAAGAAVIPRRPSGASAPPRAVLVANPVAAVADVIGEANSGASAATAPLDDVRRLLRPADAGPPPLLAWWGWAALVGAVLVAASWLLMLRALTLPARRAGPR